MVVDRRKSRSFATVRYHVDVFPEDLEEAAEMLAEKIRQVDVI
jgi:hypothetical protein